MYLELLSHRQLERMLKNKTATYCLLPPPLWFQWSWRPSMFCNCSIGIHNNRPCGWMNCFTKCKTPEALLYMWNKQTGLGCHADRAEQSSMMRTFQNSTRPPATAVLFIRGPSTLSRRTRATICQTAWALGLDWAVPHVLSESVGIIRIKKTVWGKGYQLQNTLTPQHKMNTGQL